MEFGSVGGGGRYDDLVSRFTNNIAPATGVSIGLDRLLVGVQQRDNFWKNNKEIENTGPVVICLFGANVYPSFGANEGATYNKILTELRSAGIKSEIYFGIGGIKAQMKYADKRNSPAVILYGENEAKSGTVTIKNLKLGKEISAEAKTREDWTKDKKAQITVKLENLVDEIKKII